MPNNEQTTSVVMEQGKSHFALFVVFCILTLVNLICVPITIAKHSESRKNKGKSESELYELYKEYGDLKNKEDTDGVTLSGVEVERIKELETELYGEKKVDPLTVIASILYIVSVIGLAHAFVLGFAGASNLTVTIVLVISCGLQIYSSIIGSSNTNLTSTDAISVLDKVTIGISTAMIALGMFSLNDTEKWLDVNTIQGFKNSMKRTVSGADNTVRKRMVVVPGEQINKETDTEVVSTDEQKAVLEKTVAIAQELAGGFATLHSSEVDMLF